MSHKVLIFVSLEDTEQCSGVTMLDVFIAMVKDLNSEYNQTL